MELRESDTINCLLSVPSPHFLSSLSDSSLEEEDVSDPLVLDVTEDKDEEEELETESEEDFEVSNESGSSFNSNFCCSSSPPTLFLDSCFEESRFPISCSFDNFEGRLSLLSGVD